MKICAILEILNNNNNNNEVLKTFAPFWQNFDKHGPIYHVYSYTKFLQKKKKKKKGFIDIIGLPDGLILRPMLVVYLLDHFCTKYLPHHVHTTHSSKCTGVCSIS